MNRTARDYTRKETERGSEGHGKGYQYEETQKPTGGAEEGVAVKGIAGSYLV